MDLRGIVRNLGKDPRRSLGPLCAIPAVGALAQYLATAGQPDAVFLHIPKTAGTSVFQALHRHGALKYRDAETVRRWFPQRGMVSFSHLHYGSLVRQGLVSARFDRRSYKFAFARNPYDRAVSLFRYLRTVGAVATGESFVDFMRRLERDGCEPIGLYNVRGLSQCNPQLRWLEGCSPTFIGRMDDLATGMERVASDLGLPGLPMPHTNRSIDRSPAEELSDESRAIIDEFYAEDFRFFGFETEAG